MKKFFNERGESSLEIIIGVAIVIITAAIAVPSLKDIKNSYDKYDVMSRISKDISRAQKTAIERGCIGVFSINADGDSYTFGCDYIPKNTSSPVVADEVLWSRDLPEGVTMTVGQQVLFSKKGILVTSAGKMTSTTLTIEIEEDGETTTLSIATINPTGVIDYNLS